MFREKVQVQMIIGSGSEGVRQRDGLETTPTCMYCQAMVHVCLYLHTCNTTPHVARQACTMYTHACTTLAYTDTHKR